uniref:Uncharacterized protein n=1 Tax=Arundo donax TaxID=35708 RepID=A0A0A9FD59_ARUDO
MLISIMIVVVNGIWNVSNYFLRIFGKLCTKEEADSSDNRFNPLGFMLIQVKSSLIWLREFDCDEEELGSVPASRI